MKRARNTDSAIDQRQLHCGLSGYLITCANRQDQRALIEAFRLVNGALQELDSTITGATACRNEDEVQELSGEQIRLFSSMECQTLL
ncbi:unnamed protein product [Protopolystoma xenopodis]|uniref:Uncharacterized protein n=1 Tax=Protopolystoma xenopodis TaxID=117903 RepID=A0A448XH71_9PLAT|nr:unnamed protein product [Protopolystoma xenopodis]